MVLHRLAEQPSSDKSRVGVPRSYFYALIVLMVIWVGLLAGGVVAIKSLVSLGSPTPPVAIVESPALTASPSIAARQRPAPTMPETSQGIPWHVLAAIAFCCAMVTLAIAQRLNPPTRSLRRLTRSPSQSRKS